MAKSTTVDPNSGFCAETNTFHSLRPPLPLPPPSLRHSVTSHVFSLLPSPLPAHPAFVDATARTSLSYPDFVSQVRSLSCSLRSRLRLSKGDVAFILSPSRLDLPVLCFSLLSIGVVVSPANPASTPPEISRLFNLVSPAIAFATSATASRLPAGVTTVLLDSPDFLALLRGDTGATSSGAQIDQADVAAIMFSSGTTGPVKAAALSHRRYVATVDMLRAGRPSGAGHDVTLLTSPMFHAMGFLNLVGGVALGGTSVVMDRPGFGEMMGAMERHGVTVLWTAPPVVVAMGKSEEASMFDLAALREVACGGAPLLAESAERFKARFPRVILRQGYGSTESGRISWMANDEECRRLESVGRLSPNFEARIVDVVTGKPLTVGQKGELWVRGPTVMLGYIGDEEANAAAFDPDGWLRTGDVCYFDRSGFLFVADRIKELIKYKAYQVSPFELEQVLLSMPGIVDAAVVPYRHEEVGQIPTALVVRGPGSALGEAQVMDYVAKQVAPYKKIRKVLFVSSIQKTPAGKILRRQMASDVQPGRAPRL